MQGFALEVLNAGDARDIWKGIQASCHYDSIHNNFFFFVTGAGIEQVIGGLRVVLDNESLSMGIRFIKVDGSNYGVEFDSGKEVEMLGIRLDEGEHV